VQRVSRILAASFCLDAAQAQADITGEVALLSDYRFRGLTLSDGRPSLQANLDWSGGNGWFAGIVASTVRLGRSETVAGIAGQGYLGYGGRLTRTSAWSGGLSAYTFPSTGRGSTDYQEGFLRAGSERWQAGLYLSPDYYAGGTPSAYLSISTSRPIGERFRAFAQAGWLVTGRPDDAQPSDRRSQRFDARVGLAWDLGIVIAEASIVGVTRDNDRCRSDPDACKATVVVGLRKLF